MSLDPTVGAEMQKTRRALVVSSDALGKLPLKLIAPITEWNESFLRKSWLVKIDPDGRNGLTKSSAVDVLQLRGVDISRFGNCVGYVDATTMEEVATAIATVVEYS